MKKIFDTLRIMLQNSWICILNCASWFVSIILNFNALCDVYTVQRQSYTLLIKRNIIFCPILGIILGNVWICILNFVSLFVSIILNFNALCDVYTVEIESCTVLLKSNILTNIRNNFWELLFNSFQ